jgi:phosphoribosylamine-glycine ligase
LYITSQTKIKDVLNIKFNTFRELARKCHALQIDIVLVEEEKWIQQGIADILKQNYVNCISANAKWAELSLHNNFSRSLLGKYNINIPSKVILPVEYPIIVKADGVTKKANSMQEIINIKQEISDKSSEIAKTTYLEEFIKGQSYNLISLYDGKNLITFPQKNIPENILTEYNTTLENMLKTENADFVGFINSEIIVFENKIYNIGFNFEFSKPNLDADFLYILNSAIYQKLDEIVL